MKDSGKSMLMLTMDLIPRFVIVHLRLQQGSPGLGEAVNLWRAGKADDTITVVIYSKLPVICHAQGAPSQLQESAFYTHFKMQN